MISKIHSNLEKWLITMKISWSNHTAYRMNFFLMIIGPALVFFFVKYNLWNAIYQGNKTTIIAGRNLNQMITYHAWALIIGLLAQGHTSMNLAIDIRLGRISSYLIYPFNFWEYHTASFLSFQLLQTFVATITLSLAIFFDFIPAPSFTTLIQGYFFTLIVSIFWFSIQYFTGLLAFWLDETWIFRVIITIIASFLSGATIPIDLYPQWFSDFLHYTPFPYLTYYPVKFMMGQAHDLLIPIGNVLLWSFIMIIINSFLWKRGIRLYTAAGM